MRRSPIKHEPTAAVSEVWATEGMVIRYRDDRSGYASDFRLIQDNGKKPVTPTNVIVPDDTIVEFLGRDKKRPLTAFLKGQWATIHGHGFASLLIGMGFQFHLSYVSGAKLKVIRTQ